MKPSAAKTAPFGTALQRRAITYGIFNTWYGLAWFAGSATLGMLYDVWLTGLIAVSVGLQVLAVGVLIIVIRQGKM